MDSNSSFNNFSIVIPIYNEEDILTESINNILSICERTSVDFEIIISENGSTDNTKNLAREFEQSNSNVILIESLNDAKNIYIEDTNNLAYATQTTLSVDDTKEIIEVLKQRFPGIKGPSSCLLYTSPSPRD